MLSASDVDKAPGLWRAAGAMNFPTFWYAASSYREPNHPISVEVFVSLCFEETACSNTAQGGKPVALGPGQLQVSEDDKVFFFAGVDTADPAVRRENFLGGRWDSSLTTFAVRHKDLTVFKRQKAMFPELTPLTMDQVLADNYFAIGMHWRYFDWLRNGHGRSQKPIGSVGGLLDAQTGGNKKANQAFLDGGAAIRKAMDNALDWVTVRAMSGAERKAYAGKRRAEMAGALQTGAIQFRGDSGKAGLTFFPKFWEFFLPDEYFTDPFSYR
jgi:hypothetical protein